MLKAEGRKIMKEYLNIQGNTPAYLSLSYLTDYSLKEIGIGWLDWEKFQKKPNKFTGTKELFEKDDKNEFVYRMNDMISGTFYSGKMRNFHKALVNHYKIKDVDGLYGSYQTKSLALNMNNNISNFMLGDGNAPFGDAMLKFLIKARANILFTPARKATIFGRESNICKLCNAKQMANLKHILNSCNNKMNAMTARHDNICRIVAQAINLHARQGVIESYTENLINWNKQLRLPKKVINQGEPFDEIERNEDKKRPDIWFYKIQESFEKEVAKKTLVLKMIEVTCPWGNVELNEKVDNEPYKTEHWKPGTNSLEEKENLKRIKYEKSTKKQRSG
jgi:hypothetical protein